MPVKLNNMEQAVTQVTATALYTPKFFSKNITGNGKKTGTLCEGINPVGQTKNPLNQNIPWNGFIGKRTQKNGDVTLRGYGFGIRALFSGTDSPMLPLNPVSSVTIVNRPDVIVNLSLVPTHIMMKETYDKNSQAVSKLTKQNSVLYDYVLQWHAPGTQNDVYLENRSAYRFATGYPLEQSVWDNIVRYSCRFVPQASGCSNVKLKDGDFDKKAFDDYLANYSVYNEMCRVSEHWQTTLDKEIALYIQQVAKDMQSASAKGMDPTGYSRAYQTLISEVFPRMEEFNVPLEVYRRIYEAIQTNVPQLSKTLCKSNMNLLLSDTLENLKQNKGSIQTFTPETDPAKLPAGFLKLSTEQKNAVSSAEPLVLVQSGAGCGKTHVIMNRMEFMLASGVNQSDITVLSFTNAAADNVIARNPGVHSMTIASMVHQIYNDNFPSHELSTEGTLVNCLEIMYPQSTRPAVVDQFRKLLYDMMGRNGETSQSYTAMNNFVEEHYDEVIDILNTVKQTTLGLEIIICYQKIDQLREPTTVQSKYLILDEVQDNSVFEFIYVLKYVEKNKESLFIVGDCSQTLYAFRAANPMAINILESSGVFATYPLQINFRSNQEILDFANMTLADIEANQFAHIQLQANNLTTVTEKSFKDRVHLHYEWLSKISDWSDTMEILFGTTVKPYIDQKMQAGEQVAFLAFTRQNVYHIGRILKVLYPNAKICTLVPEKPYDTTLFSAFIKKYWDDIRFMPTANIMQTIGNELSKRLVWLVPNKDKTAPMMSKMLQSWYAECGADVANWYAQYMNKVLTKDEFLNNVKECMLKFEIRNNAVRQSLLSMKNAAQKTSDEIASADFLLSTIHSAKGMEFENTVIIYRDESNMSEEDKRMYYVALTRAMKSEFVLAYGTLKNPAIEGNYRLVLYNIKNKQLANAKAKP